MDMIFRRMKKKDVPAVIFLCNEVFKEETSLDYAMNVYKQNRLAANQIYLVGIAEATKISLEKGCKKIELRSNNVRTAAPARYYNYGFKLDDAGFFEKKIRD